MTVTPARLAALATLRAVRAGLLADRALEIETRALSIRDRAWTQELVYGTFRLRGRIDHMLEQIARRPLGELDADVLDTLRLGVYQLREMGSVPAYAAVSQSVDLVRTIQPRAAGFVNGVLQRFARNEDVGVFPSFDDDPLGHLSSWGSHPAWLVERWLRAFGPEATRRLVDANNARPPLLIHAIDDAGTASDALAEHGLPSRAVDGVPGSFVIDAGTPAEALAAVRAIVQDPAASMVARFVAAPAGALVADLCAAPGGKTVVMATATERPAYVVAADRSMGRIGRLVENTRRVGPLAVGAVVADARMPPLRSVDVVLLDVPCTGTGTLRRHPDARWRLRPHDIDALVVLQREMLESAAQIVRPGGFLVYATCSLEAEENEAQVQAFLASHREFRTQPPSEFGSRFIDGNGWLRLLPHEQGFDGAFAARLRRN